MARTAVAVWRAPAGAAPPSRGVRLYVPGRDHRCGVHRHVPRGRARRRRGRVQRWAAQCRAARRARRGAGAARWPSWSARLVLLLGVLVPALVIAAAKRRRQAPGGVKLTAADERGREIFAQRCATCHTLAAAHAVGKVGPNLDQLVDGRANGKKLSSLNAIQQGRARARARCPPTSSTARTRRTSRTSSRPSPVTERSDTARRRAGAIGARSRDRRRAGPADRAARPLTADDSGPPPAPPVAAARPDPSRIRPLGSEGDRFRGFAGAFRPTVRLPSPTVDAFAAPPDCGAPWPPLRCPPSELLSFRLAGAWPRETGSGGPVIRGESPSSA